MTQPQLDEALATGRLSRLSYLLKSMRLVEERADAIIHATPESQPARLALHAQEQAQRPPVVTPRRRHWQDN